MAFNHLFIILKVLCIFVFRLIVMVNKYYAGVTSK